MMAGKSISRVLKASSECPGSPVFAPEATGYNHYDSDIADLLEGMESSG